MTLIITGDTDIDRRLLRVAKNRMKPIVRSAARKALKPSVRAIKAYPWPVDSGKMADHIRTNTRIKALGRGRSSRGKVGARVAIMQRQFKGGKEILNQGDIFYFGFHELGYVHRFAGKQEGKFRLREIADSVRSESQEIFRQECGKGIEAELRKRSV